MPGKNIYSLLSEEADRVCIYRVMNIFKKRLTKKRIEGFSGWNDPNKISTENLKERLLKAFAEEKWIDVVAFGAMLWNRKNPFGDTSHKPKSITIPPRTDPADRYSAKARRRI